ncbi:MAG: NAD+ synthase, partial [Gallionellaceae bacterium]|nr:NAD+ synthase [Gallionellaceae bacterium]
PCLFELEGVNFALAICADVWEENVALRARQAGADVMLVLNASPFYLGKQQLRHETLHKRVQETGLAIVYANMLGGQGELVFDGASFAMNEQGSIVYQLPHFEEALGMVELRDGTLVPGKMAPTPTPEESIYRALCLSVRDYADENGFPGVLLGLSGGIDSALVLAVAVDALGAEKVRAVMMPSPYTSQISRDDAREMAARLGVRYDVLDIQPAFAVYLDTLSEQFAGLPPDITEENLQARIRGNLLMALSNKTGALVLTTGNKSETAVGYCTLYGDTAGGFAPLKDVSKTWVYRLAHYRNQLGEVIPERIITRPPSAELRPDQTDQDSLPPYDVLDDILACYVENNQSIAEIIAQGYDETVVRHVVKLLHGAEYKRRQSPVGVRVTKRGFGKDWRYPVTAKYRDTF